MSDMTFCISTYNNLDYLKLAVKSVRHNSHFKDAPFVVYAENCNDGTNEWLEKHKQTYDLQAHIEPVNKVRRGIGGGMNFCASKVKTKFINFLQADIYVARDWDVELLECYNRNKTNNPDKRWHTFSQRIQPDIFDDKPRAGTVFVPMNEFGAYHDDFDEEYFLYWCDEFRKINEFEVRKAEGVSGLILKQDWDHIGGNDDRFAPAYWEDKDLYIRMMHEGFDFSLTSKSLIYHFASRSSRFPDDNLKQRPKHLAEIEQNSTNEFIKKYGKLPQEDDIGMVKYLEIADGSPYRIKQEI
jgi:GT2 family glycosyltransferase